MSVTVQLHALAWWNGLAGTRAGHYQVWTHPNVSRRPSMLLAPASCNSACILRFAVNPQEYRSRTAGYARRMPTNYYGFIPAKLPQNTTYPKDLAD